MTTPSVGNSGAGGGGSLAQPVATDTQMATTDTRAAAITRRPSGPGQAVRGIVSPSTRPSIWLTLAGLVATTLASLFSERGVARFDVRLEAVLLPDLLEMLDLFLGRRQSGEDGRERDAVGL